MENFTRFVEMGDIEISLSDSEIYLEVGDTTVISVNFEKDAYVSVESYSWSSSDPEVVSVSEDGIVTANTAGQAIITCTVTDGYGLTHTDQCLVTVKIPEGVNIAIDRDGPSDSPRYYDLRGVRVSSWNLRPGIYIVRQGDTVRKITVR